MTELKAFICGCEGLSLNAMERTFFEKERPWGFILFKRNCQTKEQIRSLVNTLREVSDNPYAPVFIDQEGGRVQRLGPPLWPRYPSGEMLFKLYEKDKTMGERATWLSVRLIAHDLIELGVDADCLPVLDVPVPGAHDVIGDRAYGSNPDTIAHLGGIAASGLLAGGVLPVIKHIPGHGRAGVDSHKDLPNVDAPLQLLEKVDFVPFKKLNHLPMAMTAHIVYSALDMTSPCSTSSVVIEKIIRQKIGFEGLLMSDDVSMNALVGEVGERTQACFTAGCDFVLHCNGKLEEMKAVAAKTPFLSGKAKERADNALSFRKKPESYDAILGRQELEYLLAAVL